MRVMIKIAEPEIIRQSIKLMTLQLGIYIARHCDRIEIRVLKRHVILLTYAADKRRIKARIVRYEHIARCEFKK